MKIVSLLINEDVARAERDFEMATSGNIVELCTEYLRVLDHYRQHLLNLQAIPEINFAENSNFVRELSQQSRKAVQATVELTETAHRLIESLLNSFTSINPRAAADTFNRLRFKDSGDWETDGSSVFVQNAPDAEKMGADEAQETAGRLRREAYVDGRMTFFDDDPAAALTA